MIFLSTIGITASEFFSSENWKNIWESIVKWFFTFGKNLLIAILVLVIGIRLISWASKLISKGMNKSKIEPIVGKFLSSLIKFSLYALLIVMIVGILGIPTSSFIAALSAAGLTIGLALQGSLSNFAGGVLILMFKPFVIGDYIYEDTHHNEGTVIGIDLFYTKIVSFDNKTIVIPNGTLANSSLTNYTKQAKRRIDLKVGIAYESNIKAARDALKEVVDNEPRVLAHEPVDIVVDELGDSQITIIIKTWVKTNDYWPVRYALLEAYKEALDAAGIEIPFNQVTVSYKPEKKDENK